MCDMCMKHGKNGKWYLNAKNYIKETYDATNSVEYLEDFWGNMERTNVQKVFKVMNMKWVSTKVKTPLLGRILKWYANRGFKKEKRLNTKAAQGHYGQVIPLEESQVIVREKAQVVAKAICPCKYFNKGIKEATCLGFSPLIEVLPKLPRFIPETGVEIMEGDKAATFLEEMSEKGYVHTIWCGPLPAIAAVCSCDLPACGALRLRRDFDIKACFKGEYIAQLDQNKCVGCGKCVSRCQFNAISFSPLMNHPIIKDEACFGCGLCRDACEAQAISLIDRDANPITRGKY